MIGKKAKALVALATVLGGLGAGAAFKTLWNPEVALAPPRVIHRARRGDRVTVLLAGDFAPTDAAMPLIRSRGYRYPYLGTADLVREADVSFANLESPITRSDAAFWPWKDYLYRVDPAAIDTWRWLGLDLVSLANNHLIDYRERGVLDTLDHLRASPIAEVGGGRDESEARRPVIFDVGGTKIGFLGYLEHRAAFNLYLDTYAVGGDPGCAQLNPADLEQDVRRLRPRVDVLVVSVHWGENYAPITPAEEEYAQRMADLGVDVIAGHHPHVAQPVAIVGRTLVLYSLGNYAWGAPGRDDLRFGWLARLTLRPRQGSRRAVVEALELVPIATQNREIRYQPRPLRAEELHWVGPTVEESRARGANLVRDGVTYRLSLTGD